MKIGKIEISKKKIIICGVVALTAIISAGVIFACNNKKNTPEIAIEENSIVQNQDTNAEEQTEQNPEQKSSEVQTNESNSESKNVESKNKGKKEIVKEDNSKKDSNKQPNAPEIKTDLKVDGDQVVLSTDENGSSSKTFLTFNGDKLSKMVLEVNSSDENMLKEVKEAYEKMGSKILEFNGKSLKAEMNGEFIDLMNKLGKKQDIIDFYKQFFESLKG